MTKSEATKQFTEEVMPSILAHEQRWGGIDWPMRQEAWNEFTDYLQKARRITMHQYETWTHPKITSGPRRRNPINWLSANPFCPCSE